MQLSQISETYNLSQNILRLIYLLVYFPLTVSETGLDYNHQRLKVRVASRITDG